MGEHGNKAMGRAKQAVGKATGDRGLQQEGTVQHATGRAQGGMKEASRGVEDALGKLGSKLAARRREQAGARPERARRDLDREY